jgi:3,4-dihydroxy-2-butanone 4-phosphate synthase
MVSNNTDPMETAFTVSVDLKGKGVTTGISAADRATIKALSDENTQIPMIFQNLDIFSSYRKRRWCFEKNRTY